MEIKATLISISNDTASLKTEDGQLVAWPLKYLPKELKTGQTFSFSITESGTKSEPEKLAKDLLNEILNIE